MNALQTLAPALGLLLLLLALAWGVHKFRQHLVPGGAQGAKNLRLLSTLALGPQHRIMVVEMTEPESAQRHLITVGVTQHAINVLHSTALGDAAAAAAVVRPSSKPGAPSVPTPVSTPVAATFQAQLESQWRAEHRGRDE